MLPADVVHFRDSNTQWISRQYRSQNRRAYSFMEASRVVLVKFSSSVVHCAWDDSRRLLGITSCIKFWPYLRESSLRSLAKTKMSVEIVRASACGYHAMQFPKTSASPAVFGTVIETDRLLDIPQPLRRPACIPPLSKYWYWMEEHGQD